MQWFSQSPDLIMREIRANRDAITELPYIAISPCYPTGCVYIFTHSVKKAIINKQFRETRLDHSWIMNTTEQA